MIRINLMIQFLFPIIIQIQTKAEDIGNSQADDFISANAIYRLSTESVDNCTLVMTNDFTSWSDGWSGLLKKRSENYMLNVMWNSHDIHRSSDPTEWDPYTMIPGRIKPSNCLFHFITVDRYIQFEYLIIELQKFIKVTPHKDFLAVFERNEVDDLWTYVIPIKFERFIVCDFKNSNKTQLRIISIRNFTVHGLGNFEEHLINLQQTNIPAFQSFIYRLPTTDATLLFAFFEDVELRQVLKKVSEHGEYTLTAVEEVLYNFYKSYDAKVDLYTETSETADMFIARYPNGTWKGAVHDIILGITHGSFGLFWSEGIHDFINVAYPIINTEIAFSSTLPGRLTSVFAFTWPYDRNMWFLILVSIVCFTIFVKFLYFMEKKLDNSIDSADVPVATILIYGYASLLKIIQYLKLPEKSDALKVFLAFWLAYILIISSGYQEMLLTYLTSPIREKTAQNLKDIVDMKYSVLMYYQHAIVFKRFIVHIEGDEFQYLRENIISVNSLHECIYLSSIRKDTACLSWAIPLGTEMQEFITTNGDFKLQYIHINDLSSTFAASGMSKELPGINMMDEFISYGMSAGLNLFWIKKEKYQKLFYTLLYLRSQESLVNNEVTKGVEVLNLHHFSGAFLLLAVFILVSFVALLCELCTECISSKCHTQSKQKKPTAIKIVVQPQQNTSLQSRDVNSHVIRTQQEPRDVNSDAIVTQQEPISSSIEVTTMHDSCSMSHTTNTICSASLQSEHLVNTLELQTNTH